MTRVRNWIGSWGERVYQGVCFERGVATANDASAAQTRKGCGRCASGPTCQLKKNGIRKDLRVAWTEYHGFDSTNSSPRWRQVRIEAYWLQQNDWKADREASGELRFVTVLSSSLECVSICPPNARPLRRAACVVMNQAAVREWHNLFHPMLSLLTHINPWGPLHSSASPSPGSWVFLHLVLSHPKIPQVHASCPLRYFTPVAAQRRPPHHR